MSKFWIDTTGNPPCEGGGGCVMPATMRTASGKKLCGICLSFALEDDPTLDWRAL